jgi:hypothetical protein
MAGGRAGLPYKRFYILSTSSFSWGLVRAFLGPTIFHYYPYSFLKVYPNAATWSSSVWQIANGACLCWFLDYFDWRTLVNVYRFCLFYFALLALSQIDKKPIMNPKSRDAEFNRRNKICLQQ